MKKLLNRTIALSLILSPMLLAETVKMDEVQVEAKINSVKINDVSGEELKSADLAESLTKTVPSISLVRRSGIANDIVLRGQKKDNINIIADGTKTYGACPNRMDPATSHILTNNIESVEVTEGPFDVENFGTLSGIVDIKTKKPSKEFGGEVNLNAGSWNYKKASATVSGGSDKVRVLISASQESSDQYKDGDGNTFSEQIDNYYGDPLSQNSYQTRYKDMEAYTKKTFMGKLFFNPTDNQELRLSYTANRSDDVLYGSSGMDALYDDSDIYNFEYSIADIGAFSKKLDFQAYHSEVDHPMSTKYRVKSDNAMTAGVDSNNEMISALTTSVDGLKLKNLMSLGEADITVGLDASRRNWDGSYTKYGMMSNITGRKSIDDVDTKNIALFAKFEQSYGKVDLEVGARYDDTSIDHGGDLQDNDYSSLNGYLLTTYNAGQGTQYFIGAGKSSRVPDARELYFKEGMGMPQPLAGTPTLDQTKNYEIDLGVKKQYENAYVKTKVFHSWLKDFIVYNGSAAVTTNKFENIDAKVYGIELSGFYAVSDALSFDAGLAYQRGKKDSPLARGNQTDRDLAEIPPLKINAAVNYDTEMTSSKVEVVAADNWSNFDSDNGEQAISGYAIANIKWNRDLTNGFDVTLGIDNVFDHTYAVSNTYEDLTLLSDGTDVILMNEPGRYIYANLRYRF